MSPDDPNSSGLNTKPDFSSVPLPEPSPIKSPYAPVGGTLGDVADDISQNDTNSANPPAPIESNSQSSEIPVAEKTDKRESDAQDSSVEASLKDKKHLKIPKIFIIIGAVAVAGIACLAVVISVIANYKDYGPGSNGKSGSFFNAKAVFAPFDANKTKYALVNDGKMGDYEYSYATAFLDGYALVKKNGEYGIIDEAGNIIVDFGEYDNIVEYGGLYGATKDNRNQLIDGQGRVIREYGDEFKDYGEIEVSTRAALTIFPEGDKKYSIYSPRGERLVGFESDDKPTISSTNLINTESTTAVIYSGGIYIYDDAGKEVQHIERNVAKKYLIIDSSKDRSVIVLSTKPGKVYRSKGYMKYGIMYEVLHDERHNAAIVNGNLNEYDNSRCTNIVYETSYSGGDGGYLACLYENVIIAPYSSGDVKSVEQYQHFINSQGIITDYLISLDSLATGSNIFPLTSVDYVVKENGGNYALYVDGKKKTSFKSRNDANGVVKYVVLNNFAGRYTVQRLTLGPTGDDSASVDLSFYDRNGNKICTLKDGYSANTPKVSSNPSGGRTVKIEWLSAGDLGGGGNLSLVTYGNGISAADVYSLRESGEENSMALIDDECNEIGNERYHSALGFRRYGYSGDAMLLVKKDNNGNYYYYSATALKDKAKTSIEISTYPRSEDVGEAIDGNYRIVGYLKERLITYKEKTIAKIPPVRFTDVLTDTCFMITYNENYDVNKRIVYVFSLDGKILYTNKKESL